MLQLFPLTTSRPGQARHTSRSSSTTLRCLCNDADSCSYEMQIHYIADNIMCCGAGTAADTEFTTAEIRSQIALHKLNTGREPRVVTAMTMLKQKLFQ